MSALAETLQKLQPHLLDNSHWGFFGGAFDPPHTGHFELAKALNMAASLDGIIIAPSFHPPHKSTPTASFAHRIAMCKLACAEEKGFIVSDIESQLPTPGFTVEVMAELTRSFPNVSFSILVGADNLRILTSWNRIEELLRMAPMVVGSRPEETCNTPLEVTEAIPAELLSRVRVVQSPLVDISSSTLRATLQTNLQANLRDAEGGGIPSMIHPDVYHYIKEHRLYQ